MINIIRSLYDWGFPIPLKAQPASFIKGFENLQLDWTGGSPDLGRTMAVWNNIRPKIFFVAQFPAYLTTSLIQENYCANILSYILHKIQHIPNTNHRLVEIECNWRREGGFGHNPRRMRDARAILCRMYERIFAQYFS